MQQSREERNLFPRVVEQSNFHPLLFCQKESNQDTAMPLFVHISRVRFCCHWSINPLTLFLHLAVLVVRKPTTNIEDCLYCELIPYPLSLSKGGATITEMKNSTLNKFLWEEVRHSGSTESKSVLDGGALVWSCNWSKEDTFSKIF